MSAIMKIIKEKYQIFNQNAITFMQTLESECIDLIIADPPYFRIKGLYGQMRQTISLGVENGF